jgi:hypothetical protein
MLIVLSLRASARDVGQMNKPVSREPTGPWVNDTFKDSDSQREW